MGVLRAVRDRNRPEEGPPAEEPPACAGRGVLDRTDRFALARPARDVWSLGLGLSPVPTMDRVRDLGCDPGGPEHSRRIAPQRPDDRQHDRPRPSLRRRRKGGIQGQGLGRSRGGFSTKIHLKTNGAGLPIAFEITGGEVSDYRGYAPLMDADGPPARVLLADRGYDSDAIRQDMQDRGGVAVIPSRKNRRVRESVDARIYALRNRIERCANRLKNARRIATRYDKTAGSFLGFVQITSIRMWIRDFVNTA